MTIVTNLMSSHITSFFITDFNMVSTVIIIMTFVVVVYGHECKDFKLSASDQSVIDFTLNVYNKSVRKSTWYWNTVLLWNLQD
jgi:hypothetical protein